MLNFLTHMGSRSRSASVCAAIPGRRRIVFCHSLSVAAAVAALTSGAGLWLVSPAGAETFSVAAAMKALDHALGEHPRLEGFTEYGSAEQQQIIKGFAIDEYLNIQYREGTPGELADHYELSLGTEAKSEVESYSGTLVDDAREESTADTTTEDAGGETLDAEAGEEGVANPVVEALPVIGLPSWTPW
jgi:hypothetical protein